MEQEWCSFWTSAACFIAVICSVFVIGMTRARPTFCSCSDSDKFCFSSFFKRLFSVN